MHNPIHDWVIGIEREAAPGYYATLVEDLEGWRMWRFETARENYFVAGKGTGGGRALIPLGCGDSLFGQTPYLKIIIRQYPICEVIARHSFARAEFRVESDRFFQPVQSGATLLAFDGKRIEVSVSSRPTERGFSKMVVERASFDLTGLNAIVESARKS